jgi:hypothetical protein
LSLLASLLFIAADVAGCIAVDVDNYIAAWVAVLFWE